MSTPDSRLPSGLCDVPSAPTELRLDQGINAMPPQGSLPVPGVVRVPTAPTVPEADAPTLTRLVAQLANEFYAADGPGTLVPPDHAPSPSATSFSSPSASSLDVSSSSPTTSPVPSPVIDAVPPASVMPLSQPSRNGDAASPFHGTPSFDGLLRNPSGGDLDRLAFPLLDAPSPPAPPVVTSVPAVAQTAVTPDHTAMPAPDFTATRYEHNPVAGAKPAPSHPEPNDHDRRLDPLGLRSEFPILQQRVNGKPLVWLDNAATTQKPLAVIDRLSHFYKHENSNIHRAAHTLAARATDAYEAARESVRRFINAPSTRDIVFVRGATEGINLVAQSWGRANISAGDEIVVTHLEHHANIVPWQMLCAEKGARLRVAPVDDSGQILLDEYAKLLGPRTKLVALTQVSNALGTITPANAMVAMAKAAGARVLVDGAQAVSHMRVDVTALQCDFYVFSGHKVFAPTGIGAVYAPAALLDATPPWQGGGNMIADVTFERTVFQPAPARFEAGTGNIADAVGLGAALDWLTRVGIDRVSAYEHELLDYGTARLATVPGLTMIGTAAAKAGVMSFVLAGRNTVEMSGLLDKEGIAVRSGHHCAQPILRRMGVEATVRASLAPYNTHDDVDALVEALCRLQAGR